MALARTATTVAHPAVSGTVTLTRSVAPTEGRVEIAAINFGLFGVARTSSAPGGEGWTLKAPTVTPARTTNNAQDVYWRVVPASAGVTSVFTISEGSENCSGTLDEIQEADTTTPILAIDAAVVTGTSLVMASLTPSVIGCLPLSVQTQDNNGSATTTVSSPWTINGTATSAQGRGGNTATRALTTDTTTAITGTWTLQNSTEAITTHMLIQPQGVEPTFGAHANFRRRAHRPALFKPGNAR